jgi:Family of unknown function (DUF5719)
MRRGRDALVLVTFLAFLAGGLAADGLSRGVTPASEVDAADDLFEERGEYCPPGVRIGKVESKLVAASPEGAAVPVGLQPVLPQPIQLPEGRLLVRRRTTSTGVDVVGYGAPVVTGSLSQFATPVQGTSAVRCAPDASATWYFAEGSSEIGYDERILLYNPFPAQAVVRVNLFTPKGRRSKANLGEIAVPESSATAVALNDFVLRQPSLGASVEVTRGRVVAWRVLFVDADGVEGATASLGVDAPAESWYFPNGEIGTGARQQISVLNPTSDEAIVTLSLIGRNGVVQPPKLVDVTIRPTTVKTFVLRDYLKEGQLELGAVSAIVRSTNGVPVVAEQTLVYDRADLEGIASEVGAAAPGEHWALAPASTRPTSESISIFNPGTEPSVVDISLVRTDRGPKTPADLQGVRLEPGGRIKLPLGSFTKGAPMMAFVDATEPVVADRFAYSSADADIAAVGGERVRGTER